MLVKTRIWEQCPHMLASIARGKWQIDPILPIYSAGNECFFIMVWWVFMAFRTPRESNGKKPGPSLSIGIPCHRLSRTFLWTDHKDQWKTDWENRCHWHRQNTLTQETRKKGVVAKSAKRALQNPASHPGRQKHAQEKGPQHTFGTHRERESPKRCKFPQKSVTFPTDHGEISHPPTWVIHLATRRPADNTPIHMDFLYDSKKRPESMWIGVLRASLRVAVWITHVGDKSLRIIWAPPFCWFLMTMYRLLQSGVEKAHQLSTRELLFEKAVELGTTSRSTRGK